LLAVVTLQIISKMPNHLHSLGWQTFDRRVESLQHLCQANAEESLSASRCLSLLEELRQSLKALMTEDPENLSITGAGQRHVTELHRLLRLLLTDAALYQSARSMLLRQQRFEQLCHHLAQLREHTQAVLAALAESLEKP
jgi:hypothetical protein